MKVKTGELTGAALDWAVAKCEFPEPDYQPQDWMVYITEGCNDDGWAFKPSIDWAQGGPIIEREYITIKMGYWNVDSDTLEVESWCARMEKDEIEDNDVWQYGPTPLIAAMRAYVASQLGDEVELTESEMEDA